MSARLDRIEKRSDRILPRSGKLLIRARTSNQVSALHKQLFLEAALHCLSRNPFFGIWDTALHLFKLFLGCSLSGTRDAQCDTKAARPQK